MIYKSGLQNINLSENWFYLVILVILLIASIAASSMVKNRYKKYSKVRPMNGITGEEAARRILTANGVTSTQITMGGGKDLSDYYNPKEDVICLSPNTFKNSSVAAIGVACHEAGHAIQYAQNYAPATFRRACIPFSNVCSKIAIPLILVGFILSSFASRWSSIALLGIILYGVAVVVQVISLPVEFDASRRALRSIREGNLLTDEEYTGAKKVLTAAALTYVVAMLSSVVQMLRLISIFTRRR